VTVLAVYTSGALATFVCEARWGCGNALAFALVWPAWLAVLLRECVGGV